MRGRPNILGLWLQQPGSQRTMSQMMSRSLLRDSRAEVSPKEVLPSRCSRRSCSPTRRCAASPRWMPDGRRRSATCYARSCSTAQLWRRVTAYGASLEALHPLGAVVLDGAAVIRHFAGASGGGWQQNTRGSTPFTSPINSPPIDTHDPGELTSHLAPMDPSPRDKAPKSMQLPAAAGTF